MNTSRFDGLLDRYLGGEAVAAEIAELDEFLRCDPALRRTLVERSLLEVHLRKLSSLHAFGEIHTSRPPTRLPFLRFGHALAAALVMLAVGVGLFVLNSQRQGPANKVVSGKVTINGAVVDRIPDGAPFEVPADGLTVKLTDGSQVELDPFSQVVIRGRSAEARQAVELAKGGGRFRVSHGGGQFRVQTPAGSVTALGTEFTVKLQMIQKQDSRAKRALAVAVTEGSVRVDMARASHVLEVGHNQVFEDDGDQNNQDDGDQNNKNDGEKNDQKPGKSQNEDDGGRGQALGAPASGR